MPMINVWAFGGEATFPGRGRSSVITDANLTLCEPLRAAVGESRENFAESIFVDVDRNRRYEFD